MYCCYTPLGCGWIDEDWKASVQASMLSVSLVDIRKM